MAKPNIKDLVMYVNKKITGNDWNTNWQKIINWFTDGKADIKVKSIELSSNGGIVNNGSLTQNGNLTVDGNVEANDIKANGKIEGDGSGLYNLVTQGVQAFTPFCVNDGHKDSVSGNGDLISATAITEGGDIVKFDIAFKVDTGTTYGKIRATTAEGSTFMLEQLNGDELAANGTFYYFISQGQTAITRLANITIHRQPTQPPSTINDVWLDTSSENLVVKKCNDNGIYEKWDYVPLGKVTVANIGSASATATVETFAFNANGYDVKMSGKYFNPMQKSVAIVDTYFNASTKQWYRVYSDGWCEQGGYENSISGGIGTPVTFLKEMKDTNYAVFGGASKNATTVTGTFFVNNLTVNGMDIDWTNASMTDGCWWEIKGFIK